MNKKCIFKMVMLLCIVVLGITACSNDEDNATGNEMSIEGTWYLSNETGYYGYNGAHSYEWNDSYTFDDTEEIYIFNADGTGQWGQPGSSFDGIRWIILDNQLTIQDVNDLSDVEELTIKSLDENTLVLIDSEYDQEDNYEYYEELTFKKLD